ncbi:MAG: DUF6174 domain-containing protein [Gemmatimonadales bacterium]
MTDPAEAFQAGRQRWNSLGIVNYRFELSRGCECLPIGAVRIVVENGVVVSRTVVATGQLLQASLTPHYPDIPGLFDLVDDAYRRAIDVRVSFDQQYGYPRTASIDYFEGVDDEISLTVTAFEADQP